MREPPQMEWTGRVVDAGQQCSIGVKFADYETAVVIRKLVTELTNEDFLNAVFRLQIRINDYVATL